MNNIRLYPLLFSPVYKDYVWGGTRIPQLYAREAQHGICAESWEVSSRPEGPSMVSNGPLAGTSLEELVRSHRDALLGTAVSGDEFPLLIKIIDAREKLSVQVHPNDANASLTGGEPKTEMWYSLSATSGTHVYAGLKTGTSRELFEQSVAHNSLEQYLVPVTLAPRQSLFIPGGRIHAIGERCLLLEIQQNSNTTYRVYDWGRMGHDGMPRELHVEQALQTINWNDTPAQATDPQPIESDDGNTHWALVSCPLFSASAVDLTGPLSIPAARPMCEVIFVEAGHLTARSASREDTLPPGTSCLIPAESAVDLVPAGAARIIRILPGPLPTS